MSLDIVVSDHILLGLCYKLCRPFVFPLEYRKQRWCIVYVCPYLNMLALFCGIGLCIWGLISIGASLSYPLDRYAETTHKEFHPPKK